MPEDKGIKLPELPDDLYTHCPPDMQNNCRDTDCHKCWQVSLELEANRQHNKQMEALREENKRLREQVAEIADRSYDLTKEAISTSNWAGMTVRFLQNSKQYKLMQRRANGRGFENVCYEKDWLIFLSELSNKKEIPHD